MPRWISPLLRLIGAALLGTTAGIHLYLWQEGYRGIHVIGPLFLVDGIGCALLALAVLALPEPLLRWVALAGAAAELGTLVGLIITVKHGLFGFVESTKATLFWQTVFVEIAGTVVLLALAVLAGLQVSAAVRGRKRVTSAI
jgi:hypothetical protein